LSAESLGWHDEQDQEERRRVRNAMYVSIGVHVVIFAALVISPPVAFSPMPQSISVELIAGPEAAAPAQPRPAARKKASPPPAPKPPVEEAAPEPPPEPAPPTPKAPVQVLPENAPKPEKKVEQVPEKKKPKEVAKAEPKPKATKSPAKEPEKSLSLDDAMKSLEDELGEDETTDLLAPPPSRPSNRPVAESGGAAESRAGVSLNPEDTAWGLAMRRRIQSQWVTLSQYQGRGLVTVLALEITAAGELLGEPEVYRSSGDPYFDDHAVQGVLKSKPLPVPPRAGQFFLIFPSEEN
jgi:outer membrane biosynthesis protein TonB